MASHPDSHPSYGPPDHAALQAQIHEYVTLAALGQDPAGRYPELAAHLGGCASCRSAVEELLALAREAYSGQIAPPPETPPPPRPLPDGA